MRTASVLFVFVLAACSSAVSPNEHTSCELKATASCTKLDQCVIHGVENRYGDEATCEKRIAANCEAGVGAKYSGTSTGSLNTCTASLPSASCGDFERDTLAACAPAVGVGATGQPCAFSEQCTSSFCSIVIGTNCGTCQPLSSPGSSCGTTTCSRGLECVTANSTCQGPSAEGIACSDTAPCGFALTCVTPANATSGICQATATVIGAPCDPKHQTNPGCDAQRGLVCDGTTKACVDLVYAGPGQPCGNVSGTEVACDGESLCFGASGTTSGTCKALALDGSACDTSVGPTCVSPARCVTGSSTATAGTCTLPDAAACK